MDTYNRKKRFMEYIKLSKNNMPIFTTKRALQIEWVPK